MYGLAVNLIVSVSGHPWIINEICELCTYYDLIFLGKSDVPFAQSYLPTLSHFILFF